MKIVFVKIVLIRIKDLETRFFVALELKSKNRISNSPDAIRSMYNQENIKIKKYQNQISQLQQSENKLKKSNYGNLSTVC